MSESDAETVAAPVRLAIVVGFTALCVGIFSFLWVNSGGKVPVVSGGQYEVAVDIPHVANLVYFSDVMVAGVKAGKVTDVTTEGNQARVTMSIDDEVAPLHEGAEVQVRAKSLVEESFLEITDGEGDELPDGGRLPAGAGRSATQLSDVLGTFDKPTREDLRSTLRSAGLATKETRVGAQQAMLGLGMLGRNGQDTVDAIADQSGDLRELTRSSARVLATLDTRRGQLQSLIDDVDTITTVTAGDTENVQATMRALPPLLRSARDSSDDLERLGVALDPVARNLSAASTDLTAALRELPATTSSLRRTLPSLDGVLDRAPATLTRVPTLTNDLDALFPPAERVLADLNPMLGYLAPYRRDLAAWFTNFTQTIALGDENGKAFRVMPVFDSQSFKGYPMSTNVGPLNKFNPLPAPDTLQEPGSYEGTYPRVERE